MHTGKQEERLWQLLPDPCAFDEVCIQVIPQGE